MRQNPTSEMRGSAESDAELSPDAIQARLNWARRQGHPHYLWPDVPMAIWRAALQAIEDVTARVLAGVSEPISLQPGAESNRRGLEVAAFTSGLGPMLGYWHEKGQVQLEPVLANHMRRHLEHGRQRANRLEGELSRVLELMHNAGVSVTVVKGMHTAWSFFPDPGARPLADIDLIIAPRDLEVASNALAAAGYVLAPETVTRRPFKSDWIPPEAPRSLRSIELTHVDNPYTIDIHDSIGRNFLGVRIADLGPIESGEPGPWGTEHASAQVMGQPLLVAFLAMHTANELRRLPLIRLVELALVIRQDIACARLSWESLGSLLERKSAERFVYPSFYLTERLAPGTIDAQFLAQLTRLATPRMRRFLASTRPYELQQIDRTSLQEALMWAHGPREHARLIWHSLWPRGHSGLKRRRVLGDRVFRVLTGRISLRGSDRGQYR